MRSALMAALVLLLLPLVRADDGVKPRLTLHGHRGDVYALTFSSDGKYLASAGQDKTVRVWDAATGKPRHILRGHEDHVLSVAFRADGDLLASGGAKIKSTDKAEPRAASEPESKPDKGPVRGREKSIETIGEVIVWDMEDGEVFIRHEFASPVAKVAYGPKNTFVAACRDGSVTQRYTCTGKVVVSRQPAKVALRFAAFGGEGSVVACDGGNDPTLWNITRGEKIASIGSCTYSVDQVALSPDGKTLATAGVNELKLWDTATGKLRFAPKGINGHTYAMAFTPDGKTLVTGGGNCHARKENGQQAVELNLWDVASGQRQAYFPGNLPGILSMAISPDGKTLATGSWNDTIALWDLSAARPVKPANEKRE